MAWTYLMIAGVFEIAWATGLKYTDGFTRLWPSVGTVLAMGVSPSVSVVCVESDPNRDRLCSMDRDRGSWHSHYGYHPL